MNRTSTDAVLRRLGTTSAVVPAIWPLEIANAILAGKRRKRSTPTQARKWTGFHASLPIVVDAESTSQAFGEILGIGRIRRLLAYDATYTELAVRRRLPFATLDERLRNVAKTAGVTVFAAG